MRIRLNFATMIMLPYLGLIALLAVGQFMLAHAAEPVSLSDALLALFNDIKGKAATAVVLMHVFQILRSHEVLGILGKIGLKGKGLQITIAVITALGFVFDAHAKGAPIIQALVEGLFTAGGAMLIFDALKKGTEEVAVLAQPVDFPAGKQ